MTNEVSKRINLSVPDAVYDDLEFWAKSQGRAIANLSAFLLESALNQAKAEGIFPDQKEQPQPEKPAKGKGTGGTKRRGKGGESD